MSIAPLITFRAGYCDVESVSHPGSSIHTTALAFTVLTFKQKDSKPWKVKAVPDPGYIYLYIGEDDGALVSTYTYKCF